MITWETPVWLTGLLLLPLLAVWFGWGMMRRAKLARAFAAGTALRQSRRLAQALLYAGAFCFAVLALAGPRWGYHWQEVHRRGIDVFVALDLSKSMLAEDVKPNRLERAKREILDLLDVLPADRIGLIAFSGDSFVTCPLTLDHEVLRMFLDDLRVGQIETGGTDIGSAINRAMKSFKQQTGAHRAIILISDGEDNEGKGLSLAQKAKEAGVRIFSVGIGTETGAPVPVLDAEGRRTFLKDRQGQTVVSKLNGKDLQKIALDTGGAYMQITGGPFRLASLYKEHVSRMEKHDLGESRKKVYENRFQWPLSVSLLLLILGFMMEDPWVLPRWRRKHVAPAMF